MTIRKNPFKSRLSNTLKAYTFVWTVYPDFFKKNKGEVYKLVNAILREIYK